MHLRPAALISAILASLIMLAPVSAQASETPTPSPTPSATEPAPLGTATNEPPDAEYYVAVTLVDSSTRTADSAGNPVPGVTLAVETPGGEELGTGTTDSEGRAYIVIPQGGKYVVTLDKASLPEGIALSGSASTERDINVFLSGATNVQFQIGVTEVQQVGFGDRLIQSTVNGLKYGLIIALAGLGLSLIFGTTGLTNFAHGELITFGAIATYVFNRGFGLPVIAAGVLAVVASAALGFLQDKALWGPLRRRGTGLIAMMIVSIGLALLARSLFQYGFGGSTKTLSEYVAQKSTSFGPVALAPKEIAIFVIAIITLAVTCFALSRTRLGKAMRAVSDNPALSASSGMRVDGVITSVWILGTALTGLSGVLLALDRQVNFQMGFKLLLLVFAAVTLGGLGTIYGALLGSIIIGLVSEVGPQINIFGFQPFPASIKDVGPLLVLILILLVRPQGILGRAQRIG